MPHLLALNLLICFVLVWGLHRMRKEFLIALRISLITLFLTGLLYPLFITGLANLFFKKEAGGSLIYNRTNQIQGSELIGQNFKSQGYFHPRPSAANYDAMASKGSNLEPTSKTLLENVILETTQKKINKATPIPIDLVTTSGSGLDPHISPESAYWQAIRIGLARDVALQRIVSLVDNFVEHPQFYFLGSPRVNVLKLNKALDEFFGKSGSE